jgi:hypothetical protein
MEPPITWLCDITYMSELTPPPLSYLADAILKVVGGSIRANNLLALKCS